MRSRAAPWFGPRTAPTVQPVPPREVGEVVHFVEIQPRNAEYDLHLYWLTLLAGAVWRGVL